jgi:type IV secretion system protein VirB10
VPVVLIRFLLPVVGAAAMFAQAPDPANAPAQAPANPPPEAAPARPHFYNVEPGTKILLNLINSISTRSAAEGDRVYLETAFPVLVDSRIVIPPGSYVTGTITQVKRAGKVKGRAELFIRFDSLTLPNGVTRDFRARASSLDGDQLGTIDRSEGKIQGDSNKAGDAMTVATGGGYGAMIGGVAAGAKGAGIGAGAGAAAGLVGVMMSRGPEATLQRGSTMEMLLDRELRFQEDELPAGTSAPRQNLAPAHQPDPSRSKSIGWPAPAHPPSSD